jgi:hypothetical protein
VRKRDVKSLNIFTVSLPEVWCLSDSGAVLSSGFIKIAGDGV